jgi:glucokinase
VDAGCVGAAGPVRDNRVALTNRDWVVDGDALAKRFAVERVVVINDFAAAATGVEALTDADVVTLQEGTCEPTGNRVVLGAGSGLGVAYAVHDGRAWRIVAGEGGHQGFAPETPRQAALADFLRTALGRVSDEAILSGPGLERVYAFVRAAEPHAAPTALDAAIAAGEGPGAVTRFALEADDRLALAAIDLFVECYGQVAGDHALAVNATGGVFVAGGLAPKLMPRILSGAFVRAFNAKAESTAVVARIPVRVVTNEHLGLLGAAVLAVRL